MDALAEALKNGSITLAQWEAGMRDIIREEFTNAMIAAKGGREFVTQSDWGYLGSLLKKQYQYLHNFAADIAKNPEAWMNGRLNMRMSLYQKASYAAFQEMVRREHIENGYTDERRVLGVADHCPGCLQQASLGWQPIGTLDPIGAEECNMSCQCEFEYRKTGEETDMLFAPGLETDMLFAPAEVG